MRYYTLEMIERCYRAEHPELGESEIHIRAKRLHSKFNTLDMSWRRSNRRFYEHNDLRAF